jgi:riboflavin kinase/FMN adenylyltransferase
VDVYFGLNPVPPPLPNPVITIGSFDGIHKGHQALLGCVQERAASLDGTGMLVTFEPHPQRVIAPDSAPPLLTTREEKLPLLEANGLDALVILPFSRELSEMEGEDFVTEVLVQTLGVRVLVLGHDHGFGRGRRGRPDLLQDMAPGGGFELVMVEAVRRNGDPITSTFIRSLLAAGDVHEAGRLLGRSYGLDGLVVKGDGRGRQLGFPTANLAPRSWEKCIPGNGVYAVEAVVRGDLHQGVCNIGVRPTFSAQVRTVEAHILDFSEEIYGEFVELRFLHKLREEKQFTSPQALQQQIESDIEQARSITSQEVG